MDTHGTRAGFPTWKKKLIIILWLIYNHTYSYVQASHVKKEDCSQQVIAFSFYYLI